MVLSDSRAGSDLQSSSPSVAVGNFSRVVLLQAVMVVDVFTWLLLVPMMLRDPDPAVAAHARRVFHSFVSYNTVRVPFCCAPSTTCMRTYGTVIF